MEWPKGHRLVPTLAGLLITWALPFLSGCYSPMDNPCGARECGKGCGECPGPPQDHCTDDGLCVDDCEGRECGLSPNTGRDCGSCLGDQTCSTEGQCGCERALCTDGHCPVDDECCVAAECGTGFWVCTGYRCSCQPGPCNDGFCPAEDHCCGGPAFDSQCEADEVCADDHTCSRGEDGDLVVDSTTCTLGGVACQPDQLVLEDSAWVLQDEELRFANVTIRTGGALVGPAVRPDLTGGRLRIEATGTFLVETGAMVTMAKRGYGGGGGGGGFQYCDDNADCKFGLGGGTAYIGPDGQPGFDGDEVQCVNAGYLPHMVGSGPGGSGGGHGGQPGSNGGECDRRCPDPSLFGDGSGGTGGGAYGGAGGINRGYGNTCGYNPYCDEVDGPSGAPIRYPPQPAESGRRGGYAGRDPDSFEGLNGDATEDETVFIGSGGGGGAGGARGSGWCCGAADGGIGGVPGGLGLPGCTGGGGGGGGATGGGAIFIRARNIEVRGFVTADGAGYANLFGGFGAGGGILLYARQNLSLQGGLVRTVGGISDGAGNPLNGGTIKLFYRYFQGEKPTLVNAGRVFEKQITP